MDDEIKSIDVSDYISHYGTKGMKWGVRKQPSRAAVKKAKSAKKNGLSLVAKNLTDSIKSTAENESNKIKTSQERKKEVEAENKLVKQAQKDPTKLTNEELQRVSQRSKLVNNAQNDANSTATYNTSKKANKKAMKNRDKLSDAELQYRINRQNNEQRLKDNTEKNRKDEHKIVEAVGSATLKTASKVVANAVGGSIKYGIVQTVAGVGLDEALGKMMIDDNSKDKNKNKNQK